MFNPGDPSPRLFGLPPGCDFPEELVRGLLARCEGMDPERLARVTLYVNTRRMQRRIARILDVGPARLLPRIRLISDLGRDTAFADLPLPVSPLRRRLELSRLVMRLIESDPSLASKAAAFDLAESLAGLIDEMQGEGVPFSALEAIDPGDVSEHWNRSRRFLALISGFLASGHGGIDPEARQRLVVERLIEAWKVAPPTVPILVAGSTGSRGTTALFIDAVARLPQGAAILPGFDTDLPWETLTSRHGATDDHPQSRFVHLLERAELGPGAVRPWTEVAPPSPGRNRLVSLALRPAPVTDAWRRDGPGLGDLEEATKGLTLIEAPDARSEAAAIAWLLRDAAELGKTAAIVTPDRMLTRRVTALLDRWDLIPDDSAGRPLALSPPGRLLRQAAAIMAGRVTLPALLALLKHPLTHAGGDRGNHLRQTRDLELHLRDQGIPWVDRAAIAEGTRDADAWAAWIGDILELRCEPGAQPLGDLLALHRSLAERLVAGQTGENARPLWDMPAGRKAAEVMAGLEREAEHGGSMDVAAYEALFQAVLAGEEVREPDAAHPGIMIWGTLEARVQGADLVILGGLNDGTWPDLPPPDPWLNRRMRADAGLLLPERRIGLAAHDFQQAIAAPEAVLTRPIRDDSAEPVPSRWLNRLTNLLEGLPGNGGPSALAAMRARGSRALALARALDQPSATVTPASRPSPRPPVAARPRKLSVTEMETLIRDPYAIYARRVLGLKPVRPLNPEPDALLRGSLLHRVFAAFMMDWSEGRAPHPRDHLLTIAAREIGAVRWPLASELWRARIDRVADVFIAEEEINVDRAAFLAAEVKGIHRFEDIDFTVHGRADRIDRLLDGGFAILDYKSGSLPTRPQMERFAVQLPMEALIAEAGGFEGIAAGPVHEVRYVALNGKPRPGAHALVDDKAGKLSTASVRAGLVRLVARYDQPETGYTARRAVERTGFAGDYDHLARFGEWDDSDPATPETVG